MADTNAFSGAKTAYVAYCSYINTLIKELGMEQTLAFMSESEKARGIKVGKSIREEAGGKEFNLKETLDTILEMVKDIGAEDTVREVTERRVVTVTGFGKCPIYEAAKASGMDDQKIETMCRANSLVFLDNLVKQFNPKLSYIVSKFRSVEDGGCVEEIVLEDK